MTSQNNPPNNSPNSPSSTPANTAPHSDAPAAIPAYALRDFIDLAGRVLREGLPTRVWIDAVIFDIKSAGKIFSLELLDPKSKDTARGACLRVFLKQKGQDAIASAVGCAFTPSLLAGVEARLLIEPSFHLRYHLGGEVIGIDPALSESILTKRLDELRADLKREDLYDLQKKTFKAPADITRLVVIHPPGSAGWADISGTLYRYEARGILKIYSLPASFEGPHALTSLKTALQDAKRLIASDAIDLVLIVRGGGAASGLAALTDQELARQVCLMPAPVVTGTGHAINRNILDDVAWHAAHTPSLALHVVIRILRRRAGDAIRSHHQIINMLDDRIERSIRPRLEARRQDCVQAVNRALDRAEAQLAALHAGLMGARQALPRELALRQNQIAQILLAAKRDARQRLATAQDQLSRLRHRVIEPCRLRYGEQVETLTRVSQALILSAKNALDQQMAAIDDLKHSIAHEVHRIFTEASIRLEANREAIGTLSLNGTLQRGYVIAVKDRAILRTAAGAHACQDFELLFQDGFLRVAPR